MPKKKNQGRRRVASPPMSDADSICDDELFSIFAQPRISSRLPPTPPLTPPLGCSPRGCSPRGCSPRAGSGQVVVNPLFESLDAIPEVLPAFKEQLFGPRIVFEAAQQWNTGPLDRNAREKSYLNWLLAHIRGKGFKFIRDFTIEIMQQTLAPLFRQLSPDANNPNIVLARLMVLYNRTGLFVRTSNTRSPKDSEEDWLPFPHHPACMLAHGKRVILIGKKIESVINWLIHGHKLRRRFSSHDVVYSKKGTDWQETKCAANIRHGGDRGINLALFGEGQPYPFHCVKKVGGSLSYAPITVSPGKFGHILVGPVDKPGAFQATFIGVENTGPSQASPQGYGHDKKCKENRLSAFWQLKWGDSEMYDALEYYATTEGCPSENDSLPGKYYGKIKSFVDIGKADEIASLTDAQVLKECERMLKNPLHLSPARKIRGFVKQEAIEPRKPASFSYAALSGENAEWLRRASELFDRHPLP